MTISVQKQEERVFFAGAGAAFLRFASCLRRSVEGDGVRREGSGVVSVDIKCLHLIRDCLMTHGVSVDHFADRFTHSEKHGVAIDAALQIIANKDGEGLPAYWDDNLKDYQKVAVKAMTVPGLWGACLFDEQGTGKTVMTLAAFDILKESGHIETACVIAPKTALNAWKTDFDTFHFQDKYKMKVMEGDTGDKASAAKSDVDILAMNYESVAALSVWIRAFVQRKKCLLIADEAFFVKNENARRSQAVREIRRHCAMGFALSGTPAPCSPADVINQVNVADDGYAFRGRSGTTGDRGKDAEIVTEALGERTVYLRRLKSEVAPFLPPKKFNIVPVQMGDNQERLYSHVRGDLTLLLRGMDNKIFKKKITNYLKQRQTLLQICGCPNAIDEMLVEENAKLSVLDSLLADVIKKRGQKAVIWTCYKQSVAEIRERYARYGVVVIDGDAPMEDRDKAIRDFQQSDNVRIFLGNPAAASAGITLHAAADAFYVTYPDKAAEFLQSLDRIHRIGQNAPEVRYHFLVCENTIEVNQVRLLQEKALIQHNIFEEKEEWPASIAEALAELEND